MSAGSVRVWDPFVRIGHWVLVAAFIVAYISEGEPRALHTFAGYAVAIYVVARIAWGFVGPQTARFGSFVTSPARALRYLVDLPRGRAARHLGHSPAGGWMVLLLLAGLLATTGAGLMLYALHDGGGPLAGVVRTATAPAEGREDPRVEFWEEAHELAANLTLLLVLLHVAGVATASRAHRENLVLAMLTGNKRPADD
jgi:cytochrome b